MPPTNERKSLQRQQQAVHYFEIKDFRPGLITDTRARASYAPIQLNQQPGAAQIAVGCSALPSGQLCSMGGASPKPAVNVPYASGASVPPYSIGLFALGPVTISPFDFPQDLIFVGIQGDAAGGFSKASLLICDIAGIAGPPSVIASVTKNGANGGGPPNQNGSLHGMSFAFTRARNASFTLPGIPTVFTEWEEWFDVTGSSAGVKWVSPDPTNTLNYFNAANISAPIVYIAHSGRIMALNQVLYQFGTWNFITNEAISYGDPPGNWVLGGATTILDPQQPSGYGSWGSLSYGELILIKHTGGAILVSGDLYAPTVTRLPAVVPTNGLINPGVMTEDGLIYCVKNGGAYLWEGGQTSRKISTIEDEFFIPPERMFKGIGCAPVLWGDKVVYPNGWVYDTVIKSWWRLDTSAFATGLSHIAVGTPGQDNAPSMLYAIDATQGINSVDILAFDPTTFGSWNWQSQPLAVSPNRVINVRELIIDVVNAGGVTIGFGVTDLAGGVENVGLVTVTGDQQQRIRQPCGVKTMNPAVAVFVIVSSSKRVILDSFVVGWEEAEPVAQHS